MREETQGALPMKEEKQGDQPCASRHKMIKRTPKRSMKKTCLKGKAIKHGASTCSSSNTTQNFCAIGYCGVVKKSKN